MLLYFGKEVCNVYKVINCGFLPPGGSRIVPTGTGGFTVGMPVSFLRSLPSHFEFQSTDTLHLFLVCTPPHPDKLLWVSRPTHKRCEVGILGGRDGRSESSTVCRKVKDAPERKCSTLMQGG